MTELSAQEVAQALQSVLGNELVSAVVGKGVRTIARWVSGDGAPPLAVERKLRNVYQIVSVIEAASSASTCRAWFMEMNPLLDEEEPVEALAAGRNREVMIAARTWVAVGLSAAA
ncbi:hypothetical protein [Leifsonia sp. Leaf264]|uniref:hypothetical protein n=1 Tax=Leifsonia sp. Leaf264 TaxID=1736314 RepID=UPI0012F8B1C4|nr:hypothetical protein [Leifsonia sp. Leaf264]